MKKIFTLICAVLLATNAFSQALDLTALIDKCSPAIFKITTYDASGNEYAVGTGFFISSTGTALSNYHVFQGASKAKIKTGDNKTYLVENVLGWSKESDMMKFTVKNELGEIFPFLKMNAVSPKQGEKIFIIGNPLGLEKSVSDGIVSSVRQDDKMGETIQVTAPISHGNSGSPLMNMSGEALGIVTYYLENGQNLNFAVSVKNLNILDPINALKFPDDDNTPVITKTNNDNNNSNNNNNNNTNNSNTDTDDKKEDYDDLFDYDNPNSTFYFIDSKIEFCTELDSYNKPKDPGTAFNINRDGGSYIYIYVSNNGKKFASDQLVIKVYKKIGTNFDELYEKKSFDIGQSWASTYFEYWFYTAGDYKIKIYTKEDVWVQDGLLTIDYKKRK